MSTTSLPYVCPKCGGIFDGKKHIQACIKKPVLQIAQMGEVKSPMEDVVRGDLRVKCPHCGKEYVRYCRTGNKEGW